MKLKYLVQFAFRNTLFNSVGRLAVIKECPGKFGMGSNSVDEQRKEVPSCFIFKCSGKC